MQFRPVPTRVEGKVVSSLDNMQEKLDYNKCSERVVWLDYCNVIAMVFVIMFHIPFFKLAPFSQVEFMAVNIPFFIFSGMSFYFGFSKIGGETSDYMQLIGKSSWRLLKPTLLFYTFFYILWIAFGRTLGGDTEPLYIPLIELLLACPNLVCAPFWFVFCLLIMRIFVICLYRLRSSMSFLVVASTITYILSKLIDFPSYYELNKFATFIPFFLIGFLFGAKEYKKSIVFIFVIMIIEIICLLFHHTPVDTLLGEITGLALLSVIIMISQFLSKRNFAKDTISLLRYGALVLLATQNYIIGLVRVLSDKYIAIDFVASNYWLKPIIVIIIYCINIPIILFIKRYCSSILK